MSFTILSGRSNLHSSSRYQTFWAFLLILFVSMWVLNANPFAGETVAPFDLLLAQKGWEELVQWNVIIRNNEASDVLDGLLPVWITLKEQIRSGKGALWYPYAAGGKETDLVPYNPAFILFLIIKDNAFAYYMVGLFKLITAGFGGYLLLKTFLKWAPSVWGGLVFMLCGFNIAWFFYEQVSTAMWIPWLLAAAVMYLKTEDIRWLPAVTLTALLLILGGFLSVAAFGLYAFGLLILTWNAYDFLVHYARASVKDSRKLRLYFKKAVLPMFSVGIAFMLAAIALIPFIGALTGINLSHRAASTTAFNGGGEDLLRLFSNPVPPHIETTAYIGIPVVILAFISVFRLFRSDDEDFRKFIFFHLFLVLITSLITFGLLPAEVIRTLPVFSNNPWSRLIVVLLLALSVLSSVGLDFVVKEVPAFLSRYLRVAPVVARPAVMLVVVSAAAFQLISQKAFFSDYVAAVPSTWFYPLTPSIQHVKERIKPLQSVIADNSFLVSGTLGAYGIPEWYGHSLFSDREKAVLGNIVTSPFITPTAASINAADIFFRSYLMDKLAIKYLLVNKYRVLNKTMHSWTSTFSEQAPPLPANSWRQRIYINNDISLNTVGFLFSTYDAANAPANLRLRLCSEHGGQCTAESWLNKDSIINNSWSFFEFPGSVPLSKGAYYLELSLPAYTGPGSLSAQSVRNSAEGTDNYLEINGRKSDLSLKWQMSYYEKADSGLFGDRWDSVDLEKNIVVLENRNVTNGAYFVRDLDPSNDQTDFSGLEVGRPSSDKIDVAYHRQDPGWIVLPVRLRPGWKAYIDGRQVSYDSYLGILPAIPVNGPGHIVFSYRPASFWMGLTISLIGLGVFLSFSIACLKKGNRAE